MFDPVICLDYRGNFVAFVGSYLFADCPRHCHREGPDVATAQALPFALVTEELQFSLLLLVQTVAVAYLNTDTSVYSTFVKLDLL